MILVFPCLSFVSCNAFWFLLLCMIIHPDCTHLPQFIAFFRTVRLEALKESLLILSFLGKRLRSRITAVPWGDPSSSTAFCILRRTEGAVGTGPG